MRRVLILGALLGFLIGPAQAQYTNTTGGLQNGGVSYTLSTTATYYVQANATRQFIMIDNPSATINVGCAFGQTAALNTGGTFMVPAGSVRWWPVIGSSPGYQTGPALASNVVPTGAINCIAASGSPTITILTVP